MPELTAAIAADVVAACQQGAAEAAQALSRALDATLTMSVGESGAFDAALAELDGPGLLVTLVVGSSGAVVLLPQASGLVPAWCQSPDPTSVSKLATLAQELGLLLLPESATATDFKATYAPSLRDAVAKTQPASDAACIPLELSSGEHQGTMRLIWPCAQPLAALTANPPQGMEPAAPPDVPHGQEPHARPPHIDDELSQLPEYTRSLLRIRVPVRVTLAEKRQSIESIVRLGPGSLIQFEKSCEETLDLEVGEQRIARGEAVKVGDKFGLRVTSITLPEERFRKVGSY